jgi:hypothetical protein
MARREPATDSDESSPIKKLIGRDHLQGWMHAASRFFNEWIASKPAISDTTAAPSKALTHALFTSVGIAEMA